MTATTSDEIVFPGPDEIEGFWALDKMHAPRPVTPLSFDLIVRTLSEGFTKAQAEYDCPMMASSREINHYFYMAFHPIPDEAELADRMTRYHDKLAEKVPGVGKTWEEEWKPAVRARNEGERTADYSGLSDEELVAKLDEYTDEMRHQWWIHGHINFVLLSSSAFCDLYDELMEPEESTESYQALQGFHTRSVDAQRGLWDLSRRAKASPALSELLRTREPAEILVALEETEEGRAFKAELDAFLFEFGWRHDAVYDLADVPWREDPSIPLASIAGLMELGDDEDPEAQYQKNVATREALMAKVREKLADDPEKLARLEKLYEAAVYSFPLTEDHAFYIDQLGVSVFRRFVLMLGDRLVAKSVLDAADDVFFLYRDELVDALRNGGDRRALAAGRRASMEKAAQVVPPGALGTPPPPPDAPDPFMDALVIRLLGVVPPEDNPDPNVLRAVSGSPGSYTGTARVVRSLAEGTDLEDGRGHGLRDDPAALGAAVLDRRCDRLRRRRRALALRHRGPRVRQAGRRRHAGRHQRDPDRPDHHRRRHERHRLPRRPPGLTNGRPVGRPPSAAAAPVGLPLARLRSALSASPPESVVRRHEVAHGPTLSAGCGLFHLQACAGRPGFRHSRRMLPSSSAHHRSSAAVAGRERVQAGVERGFVGEPEPELEKWAGLAEPGLRGQVDGDALLLETLDEQGDGDVVREPDRDVQARPGTGRGRRSTPRRRARRADRGGADAVPGRCDGCAEVAVELTRGDEGGEGAWVRCGGWVSTSARVARRASASSGGQTMKPSRSDGEMVLEKLPT